MVRSLGVQKPTPGFTLNCRYCSPWFSSEKEAPLSWMATTARCLQGVVLPADPCSTKGCGNCKAVLSPRQSRMGSRKSTDFRGCRPVPLNHASNTTRLLGSGLLKGPQNLADVGSVLGMLQHLVPPLPGDILLSLCFLHLEHSPPLWASCWECHCLKGPQSWTCSSDFSLKSSAVISTIGPNVCI